MGSAKVLVVGFDASDPRLATQLTRDGLLPALRSLLEQGTRAELPSPWGPFCRPPTQEAEPARST